MSKVIFALACLVLIAGAAHLSHPEPQSPTLGSGRTITNPATGAPLSSAIMRQELQTLEDEITSIFGVATTYGTTTAATSTPIWAKFGLYASSTSQIAYATSTALTVSGTGFFEIASSTFATSTYFGVTGRATSTFANGINLTSGGCFAIGGACVGTNTGTVTQVNTTYPIQGGPITTTGTLTLAFGTSTQATWNHQIFNSALFTVASTTNATSTNETVTGNVIFSAGGLASSLLWTDAGGSLRATTTPTATTFYSSGTTGNRFPYASTTAVSGTDLFFTNITLTNATTTNLSVSGNSIFSAAALASSLPWIDAGGSLRATTTPTAQTFYATSNTASRFPYASSTNISSSGSIITNATSTNLDISGNIRFTNITSAILGTDAGGRVISTTTPTATDFHGTSATATSTFSILSALSRFLFPFGTAPTTNAQAQAAVDSNSGQLRFNFDGATTVNISATTTKSFNIASTNMDAMGKTFSTGTSTFLLMNDPRPLTLLGFYCVASSSGTAHIDFGDGTNFTETGVCTSGSFVKTSTNNTWTSFEDFVVRASSTAPNKTSRITVTPVFQETTN